MEPDTSSTFVASYAVSDFTYSSNPSDGGALAFNDSGLKLYILSDKSHLGNTSETSANRVGMSFNTSMTATGILKYYTLTTPYDLTTRSYQGYKRVPHYSYASFGISGDGKWLVNGAYSSQHVVYYPIPTAWDITSIDASQEVYINYASYNSSGGNSEGQIGTYWPQNDNNYYSLSYNVHKVNKLPWGPTGSSSSSTIQPTQQYHVAVTNSGGQIDSSNFVDINSMTAAENAGTGTALCSLN